MKIKNVSDGIRIINVVDPNNDSDEPKSVPLMIGPRQTAEDVEVFDEDDRVFRGMVDNGDLVVDDDEPDEEQQKQRRERQFVNDRNIRSNREAAEEAGRTLADPLPEGTDTEGGEEAREARQRLGLDDEGKPEGERSRQRAPRSAARKGRSRARAAADE